MNPEIEAQLRLSVNLPSPPGVATHIIELAQDPSSSGQGRQGDQHGLGAHRENFAHREFARSMRSGARARTCARRWWCSA